LGETKEDGSTADPFEIPLVAYKAIPIRAAREYRYISAPENIIYSSSGYPNFYKNSMKIYAAAEVNTNDFAIGDIEEVVDKEAEVVITWEIWNPYNELDTYIGAIKNKVL
jgi:hypothetical protein